MTRLSICDTSKSSPRVLSVATSEITGSLKANRPFRLFPSHGKMGGPPRLQPPFCVTPVAHDYCRVPGGRGSLVGPFSNAANGPRGMFVLTPLVSTGGLLGPHCAFWRDGVTWVYTLGPLLRKSCSPRRLDPILALGTSQNNNNKQVIRPDKRTGRCTQPSPLEAG